MARWQIKKDIAVICGLSGGTVSYIVDDLRQKLSYRDAQALRELAINIERNEIDAAQCTQ